MSKNSHQLRWSKPLAALSMAVMVSVCVTSVTLQEKYGRTSPPQPDINTGQVNQQMIRGKSVYLRTHEAWVNQYLLMVGLLFGAVGSVLWRVAEKGERHSS